MINLEKIAIIPKKSKLRQKMLMINGSDESGFIGKTANDFIKFKNYDIYKLAIELNGEILSKDKFNQPFNDGDVVEIVHFVGGG